MAASPKRHLRIRPSSPSRRHASRWTLDRSENSRGASGASRRRYDSVGRMAERVRFFLHVTRSRACLDIPQIAGAARQYRPSLR